MPGSVIRAALETAGSGVEAVTTKWQVIMTVGLVALLLLFLLILLMLQPLVGLVVVAVVAIVYLKQDGDDLL